MKIRILAALAVCIMACASFVACSSDSDGAPKTVSISNVSFTIANRPTDWFSASATYKPNLVYDFALMLNGNLSAADIAFARIYLPGSDSQYWEFPLAQTYNPATKTLQGAFFDSGRSVNGDNDAGRMVELPVGTMNAVVRLTNGVSSSRSFTMGVPGSTSTGGISYVFSPDEEAAAVQPAISAPALSRPTVTSFTGGGTSPLVVSFTVHGSNVHNGWVWFYSDTGYVGSFYPFRVESDGTVSTLLNGGIFNASNGDANALTVEASDLMNGSAHITSAAYSSISYCRVVVCDGLQYEAPDRWAWYDYQAISSKSYLTN